MSDEEFAEYIARSRMRQRDEWQKTKDLAYLILIFLGLIIFGLTSKAHSAEDLKVATYPPHFLMHNMGAETEASLMVYVEPHPENTKLEVIWWYTYPGGGGRSGTSLDEASPRVFMRTLRHITPGTVYIQARLTRGKKTIVRDHEIEVK